MRTIIAAIIIMLPLLLSGAQATPGVCAMAGSDLAAAVASASGCLEIPAGEYTLSGSSGALLQTSAPNLDIAGAGMGRTIVRITGTMTVSGDLLVWRLLGAGQRLHDLTVRIDAAGIRGVGGIGAVSVGPEGEHITIERVEVVGGYSSDGARGFGIGTYRPYNVQGGAQYVTIRDCFIHDGPATGIGVNSSNNIIAHNHIARVGLNSLSHGIYAQGGYNLYEGNTIERASGWSIHGYKQVPNLDSAGDRYVNNTSIDPGSGHIVVNGPLARSAVISGNVLRGTGGRRVQNGIWCNGVPCIISGNVLEDVFVTSGGGWIEDTGGSIITGNSLATTGTLPDGPANFAMIRAGAGAQIADNRLTLTVGCCAALVATGGQSLIDGNSISLPSAANVFGNGLVIGGDGQIVTGNRVVSTGIMTPLALSGIPTNVLISGNYFKRTTGALFSLNLAGVTGRISGNMYDGSYTISNAAPGVVQ